MVLRRSMGALSTGSLKCRAGNGLKYCSRARSMEAQSKQGRLRLWRKWIDVAHACLAESDEQEFGCPHTKTLMRRWRAPRDIFPPQTRRAPCNGKATRNRALREHSGQKRTRQRHRYIRRELSLTQIGRHSKKA